MNKLEKKVYDGISMFVILEKSNEFQLVFNYSDYKAIIDNIYKKHKNAYDFGAWERGLLKYFREEFAVDWDYTERYTETIDGIYYVILKGRSRE